MSILLQKLDRALAESSVTAGVLRIAQSFSFRIYETQD